MDNDLIARGLEVLRGRLPNGWRADAEAAPPSAAAWRPDGMLRIVARDRRRGRIGIEAKRRVEPRDALALAAASAAFRRREPLVVIAPFLSRATRERLREAGLGWVDLTANIRLALSEPGLFIETTGAEKRPSNAGRPARSLKGLVAGRVVQALLGAPLPVGVRDLAERAGTDAGYVSRLLDLLDEAALVERGARSRVERVERVRLVRRWAEDAPLASRGEVGMFLEPRGLTPLIKRLKEAGIGYAVSGSLAAQRWAPIAPPRLAQVYVDRDVSAAAAALGLRPAESGANVQLVQPRDRAVFQSAAVADDGVSYASPAQVAADLLTSPGRGPSEGEELLRWMAEREEVWRV